MELAELELIGKDHVRRYQNAAMIFTISERLRQSFIDLYGIHPDKVMTAYAGPNFDMDLIKAKLDIPKPAGPPTILFIAKEFKRKGGDTVAEAFKIVQSAIPDARLIFAGSSTIPSEFEGIKNIISLGLLDKSNPPELDKLLNAYRKADLMVLPSRHDPFPTVIREAMFFGLPCVTSNIWAMPEMVEDGHTGFLVNPGDSQMLAERMIQILKNPELRESFGRAAMRRAESMFNWQSIGKVLANGIKYTITNGSSKEWKLQSWPPS